MNNIIKKEEYNIILPEEFEGNLNNLICPICEYMIRTSEDYYSHYLYGCCHSCHIQWIDGEENEKKWKDGWRPSETQIKETNLRKSKTNSILTW